MLLLMVEAQGDQLGEPGLAGIAEQRLHGAVDVGAVARDLLDARAREQAAFGTRMAGAHGLVVRVEDVGVRIVVRRGSRWRTRRGRTSRRTTSRAPGAIWSGSRRASSGRSGPRRSGRRPAVRWWPGRRHRPRGGRTALLDRSSPSDPSLRHPTRSGRTRWLHGCGSPYPDVPPIRRVCHTFHTEPKRVVRPRHGPRIPAGLEPTALGAAETGAPVGRGERRERRRVPTGADATTAGLSW